jgi:hypothetical protein
VVNCLQVENGHIRLVFNPGYLDPDRGGKHELVSMMAAPKSKFDTFSLVSTVRVHRQIFKYKRQNLTASGIREKITNMCVFVSCSPKYIIKKTCV